MLSLNKCEGISLRPRKLVLLFVNFNRPQFYSLKDWSYFKFLIKEISNNTIRMGKILHVILTGGVGSRLWPLSRQSRPKQYLQLFSENSLFELAVKRNAGFSERLIVVGNQKNKHLSIEGLQKLNINNYTHIVEATPRNTAPAIAFAAFASELEDILLVTPADHIINEGEAYDNAIFQAIGLAQKDAVVTFGVKPTKPETGYGYIEFDGDEVLSFREKPDRKNAEDFISSGNFLWNSGMFCFKAGIFLEELEKYAPEVYRQSLTAWKVNNKGRLEKNSSLNIPSISLDYAVMERSQKIKVVKADFEWSDMGSFEAVYDYLKEHGQPVDSYGNMHIGSTQYTAFAGLHNCILVQTDDANLVLAKESSQEVKNIYQELEITHPSLLN